MDVGGARLAGAEAAGGVLVSVKARRIVSATRSSAEIGWASSSTGGLRPDRARSGPVGP
jgi:hypothetical protein